MTTSQKIAPHLPYLRRFARALTGSQESGDAYVTAVLESLLADPAAFRTDVDARVALYRLFLEVWSSLNINLQDTPDSAGEGAAAAARNLQAITPRPRQAFLLTSVEQFSPEDTAVIMGTDVQDVARLLDEAGREIAEQVATDALIIEDEPLIAMDLESIVTSLGHRIASTARTHKEAVSAVKRKRPGLVLADIQLGDGSSGLKAVNEILQSIDVPVIFVTAFPERLLTGERPEPAFLVTKPFGVDTLKALISQALFFDIRSRPRGRRAV